MKSKISSFIRNMMVVTAITGITLTAHATDGTINFTGSILDSACTVNSDSVVNLGQISKSSLSRKGDVAASTHFTIELENCPSSVKSASVKFDGVADANDTNILALAHGQTAKGVGIALYENDGVTPVPLSMQSKPLTFDTSSLKHNEIEFVAKFKATGDDITAGTANASSNFTITYQ
ncbi:fimbrial protein [Escherichia coli]|nr:fimbrial protein [Escherichia coli]